ncbi:hypothetical protein N9Y92_00230 [Chlamydiales bacterium]|nr:hypothetical protein [Chlamydiales bacterium]
MNLSKWFLVLGIASSFCLDAGCGYTGIWDVYGGYRHDAFDWSIAGVREVPNVKAEIDFKNIHSIVIGTRSIIAGSDTIYMRCEGYWGWILQQDAVYSLYALNDKKGLLAREEACRGGDKMLGAKAGLGFHTCPCAGPFDLAFILGGSVQQLRLSYRDPKLVQHIVVEPENPLIQQIGIHPQDIQIGVIEPGISVDNLYVKYRPELVSGFLGMDSVWRYKQCMTLMLQYELHFGTYRAKGKWQYEEQRHRVLPGHEQERFLSCWKDCSNAWGNVFNLTWTYHTSDNWYFGVNAGSQFWRTRKGEYSVTRVRDRTTLGKKFVATIPVDTANLNPMHWTTYFIGINFQCQF